MQSLDGKVSQRAEQTQQSPGNQGYVCIATYFFWGRSQIGRAFGPGTFGPVLAEPLELLGLGRPKTGPVSWLWAEVLLRIGGRFGHRFRIQDVDK